MLKLYRLTEDEKLYWETWEEGPGRHIVHWGTLGTQGETRNVGDAFLKPARKVIQSEIDALLAAGFTPISQGDHAALMIEYLIDGMGTDADLSKRHRLEDRLNETLGWTGLGACDGGSTGSGTMEVCSFVVDFETARKVIASDLSDTEFSDYFRIYREDAV